MDSLPLELQRQNAGTKYEAERRAQPLEQAAFLGNAPIARSEYALGDLKGVGNAEELVPRCSAAKLEGLRYPRLAKGTKAGAKAKGCNALMEINAATLLQEFEESEEAAGEGEALPQLGDFAGGEFLPAQ